VGLKTQVEAAGMPEQERVTISENPFNGVIVRTLVAKPPGLTLSDVGFAVTEKSGSEDDDASAWVETAADDEEWLSSPL
jgi:hypothetical protein